MKVFYRFFLAPLSVLLFFSSTLFLEKSRRLYRLRKKSLLQPQSFSSSFWIHASSGEFEYAKPLIRKLKERYPDTPIVATYSSPSYQPQIADYPGVDHSEPLPLDLQGPLKAFIDRLNPRALFIARTDMWPECLWQCEEYNIPRLLFSFTMVDRPKGLQALVKKTLLSSIDFVFASQKSDLSNLRSLMPGMSDRSVVTGDTRADQVKYRLETSRGLKQKKPDFQILAGSTWPEDEAVLLDSLAPALLDRVCKLILVPHEPSRDHIEKLQDQLENSGLESQLYSQVGLEYKAQILIVDQLGLLASLYPLADVCFIGGSFKKKVHSVMESLGAHKPTCVGPYYRNNREAVDFHGLRTPGGLPLVTVARNSEELKGFFLDMQQHLDRREEIEVSIKSEMEKRFGATERILASVESHYGRQLQSHS